MPTSEVKEMYEAPGRKKYHEDTEKICEEFKIRKKN
jgi:hypothetical protein